MVSRTIQKNPIAAGDGWIQASNRGATAWNVTHDAAVGTANDTNTDLYIRSQFAIGATPSKDVATIARAFFPVDFSDIPKGAVVDSASFQIRTISKVNGDNDGDDWINIVGPTDQVASNNLQSGDYNNCGAVDDPQELATRKDLGSISAPATIVFSLNSTALALISSSGGSDLMLGMREGHDALDNPISGTNDNSLRVVSSNSVFLKPVLTLTDYAYPQIC